jgi:hypothetical protein
MDNSEKDIEDLFNDRFKEDEAAVSNRVWDNIKKTLPKDTTVDTNPFWSFNKKIFFSIFLLLIVSGISFFSFEKIMHQQDKKKLSIADKKTERDEIKGTVNTEQKIEKNTNGSSVSEYSMNKNLNIEKEIASNNDDKYNAKKNKNTVLKNKSFTELKPDNNKQSNVYYTYTDSYSDDSNRRVSKQQRKIPVMDINNNLSKNKNTVAKNDLGQTNFDSKNSTNSTITQNVNTPISNVTTEIANKNKRLENLNSFSNLNKEKDTVHIDQKSENEITLHSSVIDNMNVNKIDKPNDFSLKNDLNNINENNSTSVENIFPDSTNFSKNKKTESPIISEIDSASNIAALKENPENAEKPESAILASPPIVSEKNSPLSDSIPKQVNSIDTLTLEKKKETKNNTFLSKLSFDLLASPGITGTYVSPNFTDSISQQRVQYKKNNSTSKATLSGGLRINYSVSERLNISVGIFYTNYSQTYKLDSRSKTSSAYVPDSSVAGTKQDSIGTDTSGHPIYGPPHLVYNYFKTLKSSTTEYPGKTVTDHYTFISIPLTASYAIINKRIGIVCIGGVTTNLLMKGVSHYINESFTDLVSNTKFTSINLGITGGIGFSYKITKHLSFILEPRVNYFLSNMENSNSFIKQKPHSINVNTGLRFKF